MKAVILAAGLGTRLRPLTLHTPKPLVKAGKQTLIDWHLQRLTAAGIRDVCINLHHFGSRIKDHVSKRWALNLVWSHESTLLDTGGALLKMRSVLGTEPFMVTSSDIWTDYPLAGLCGKLSENLDMFLVLVPNPPYHRPGDYGFVRAGVGCGLLAVHAERKFSYAGMAVMRPALLDEIGDPAAQHPDREPVFPLRLVIDRAIANGRCAGEVWRGRWHNIGTVRDLVELEGFLRDSDPPVV